MKEIYATDSRTISDFKRVGLHYHKVEETDSYMIWEMKYKNKVIGWEIWKPKMTTNPDGNVVWTKPRDEDFGHYGWYCTTEESLNRRKELLKK